LSILGLFFAMLLLSLLFQLGMQILSSGENIPLGSLCAGLIAW
jgi:hypothetical protein